MDKSPDAFRTISEVAEHLETPAHVLRFWESRFPQIRPVKRAGGRRYYRPSDVALLVGIKRLLHDEGMTIRGVQKILREQGVRHVSGMADDVMPAAYGGDDLHDQSAIPHQAEVVNFGVAPGLAAAMAKALENGPTAASRLAAPSVALPESEPAQGALWLTPAPQPISAKQTLPMSLHDLDANGDTKPDVSSPAAQDHMEFATAAASNDALAVANGHEGGSFGDDFDDDFDGGPMPTLASRIRALPPEASAANVAVDLVAIVARLKSLRDDMASAARIDQA